MGLGDIIGLSKDESLYDSFLNPTKCSLNGFIAVPEAPPVLSVNLSVCLHSRSTKGPCTHFAPLKIGGPVPQFLKQVVNLSCYVSL